MFKLIAVIVITVGTCKAPAPQQMECDGDPSYPLHCSSSHGKTVCADQPELCEP